MHAARVTRVLPWCGCGSVPLSILGGGAGPRSQISWRTSSSPTPAPRTVQYSTVQYNTVQYILYPDTSTGDCASSTLS